tara:strand:- start:34643 stop:35308 length:666 start_codon:yes stop_codon:yes gene_type:complete
VLSDFDDTAAHQNVAELLLKTFGDSSWETIRAQFRNGDLTLKDYQEIVFRNISVDIPTMQQHVRENASLRPYFGELAEYCCVNNFPMAIVSQGLDFYIEALIQGEGYSSIPIFAVNTSINEKGISYQYNYVRPGNESQGNSKGLIVNNYQKKGHTVYYIGDGRSDFEAALEADVVFAHSVLAEECQRKNIPFIPFRDFGDVLRTLQCNQSKYEMQSNTNNV